MLKQVNYDYRSIEHDTKQLVKTIKNATLNERAKKTSTFKLGNLSSRNEHVGRRTSTFERAVLNSGSPGSMVSGLIY